MSQNTAITPLEDYIYLRDAADLMGCSMPTIRRWYLYGFDNGTVKLATEKMGGKVVTTRKWIDDFIAARSERAQYPIEDLAHESEASCEYLRAKGVLQ